MQPKVNTVYWRTKIANNQARDGKTTVELRTAGWTVLRFWTHVQAKAAAVQIAYVGRSKRLGRDSISLEKFKSKKRSGGASESS
jgi:DNA mismatch endonuclease (patch repair protein)